MFLSYQSLQIILDETETTRIYLMEFVDLEP